MLSLMGMDGRPERHESAVARREVIGGVNQTLPRLRG